MTCLLINTYMIRTQVSHNITNWIQAMVYAVLNTVNMQVIPVHIRNSMLQQQTFTIISFVRIQRVVENIT